MVGESVTTVVVVGESGAAESLISRALYRGVRCDGSGSDWGVGCNSSGSWGVAVVVGESDATAVVVGESGVAKRLILSHCDLGGGLGVGRDGGGSCWGVRRDGSGSHRGVRHHGCAVVVIGSRTRRWCY